MKPHMKIKRLFLPVSLAVISLFTVSCAKNAPVGTNDANKRYFDAWLHVNDINVTPTGRGIYVLEDVPGTGREIIKDGYVYLDYRTSDLEGNITSYTDAATAKLLGEYDPAAYYGPNFIGTYEDNIYAGVADLLLGMKVGGKKKAIIPSWLFSYEDYESESDYLKEASSSSSAIYEVSVKSFIPDINEWQIDSIGKFFNNDKVLINGVPANKIFTNEYGWAMTPADSVQTGFYYKQLKAPTDTAAFASDTTIYINYTGRLLNGQVFDTTIEDIAKDYNIYSPSRTYEPVQINWSSEAEDEDYTGITMGSDESEIIGGFALTLWQMRAMEKGIGVFYSALGYDYSGSGKNIPPFSPLMFEIEIVEAPEE